MVKLSDISLEWLIVLVVLIITSILDVLVLNFFVQPRSPRSHNKLKVINECLARHQLAYPILYITIMLVCNFNRLNPHEALLVRSSIQVATLLSVLFWLSGLNGVADQDRTIEHDHICKNAYCVLSSWGLRLRVLALTTTLALAALGCVVWIITRPEIGKALTRVDSQAATTKPNL